MAWSGSGLIITGSQVCTHHTVPTAELLLQDRSIKLWNPDGRLTRTLEGHGHWVNSIALSTYYVLRTGCFDHHCLTPADRAEAIVRARGRYDAIVKQQPERLVSGSDDFTLYLWDPAESKKPIHRMTGACPLVSS